VILVGGYGNIGDALIRRRALSWIRGEGEIHAYVGKAPGHWLEQMGLGSDDLVYDARRASKWVWRLLRTPGRKSLIFDPGEVLLSRRRLAKELGYLGLTLVARATGAVVVRNPRAIRQPSKSTLMVHRMACRASSLVYWRDQNSLDVMRCGRLVPDIGFSEPQTGGGEWADRSVLTISLRGHRRFPTQEWLSGVRGFADTHGLTVQLVSQVREDEERSGQLASALGAKMEPWGERDDLNQEYVVREIYSRSAYVISDRMHVLVLALLAGAFPLEVVEAPVPKIRDHFQAIGISGVSFDTTDRSSAEIQQFLASRSQSYGTLGVRLAEARAQLDDVEMAVRLCVRG
jgi:hypothetical protein